MSFIHSLNLVESHSDQAKLFLYALAIWTTLFLVINSKLQLKSLARNKRDDTINRIVSIIHGTVSFWYSLYIILCKAGSHYSLDEWPGYSDQNTWHMQFCMIISMSYFAYDFMACIHYKLADTGTVAHHCFALMGFGVAVLSKMGGTSSLSRVLV